MKISNVNLLSKVKAIRTLWGLDLDFSNLNSVQSEIKEIKNQGFSGVEIATGFFNEKYRSDFLKILNEYDLKVVTQIHTNGYPIKSNDLNVHLEDFKFKLEKSMDWNPVLINSHSGTDFWNFEKNIEFFAKANEISEEFFYKNLKQSQNLSICHETHRQRILFNHFNSFEIFKKVPNVKINLDLSHWIVTSERLLSKDTDYFWDELKKYLIENTCMIHARVSSLNNIQVFDPVYCPEYETYFYSIWRDIIKQSKKDTIYIDYEYGPEPYLIKNPLTDKPFTDIKTLVMDQKFRFESFLDI